jgi:hypothetical protein
LKEEKKGNSLEYLHLLNYYYDCRKLLEHVQRQILKLAKENTKLAIKYPNFLLLCACFLANSMIFLRFRSILDEMDNFKLKEEQNQLTVFERGQLSKLLALKKGKYLAVIKDYEADFSRATNKLLSYKQRKELDLFEKIFQLIQ